MVLDPCPPTDQFINGVMHNTLALGICIIIIPDCSLGCMGISISIEASMEGSDRDIDHTLEYGLGEGPYT